MRHAGRILLLAAVLSSTIALSGCVNLVYKVDVKDNGSGTLDFEYSMEKSLVDSLGSESPTDVLDEETSKKAEDAGLKATAIDTDDLIGVKLSGEFDKADEFADTVDAIGSLLDSGADEGMAFDTKGDLKMKRGLFSNEYTLTFSSAMDMGSTDGEEAAATAALLGDSLTYSLEAVMPGTITESNGEFEKGGNTVTWEAGLVESSPKTFTVVSSKTSIIGILLLVGLGALVLVGIAIAAVVLLRKKKASAAVVPAAVAPAAVPTAAATDGKFCPSCGAQMKAEDRFCPTCGYSGETPAQ